MTETKSDRNSQLKQADMDACTLLSKGDVISHEKAFELFRVLKSGQYFTTARRLMERIEPTAPSEVQLQIGHNRSLCTYKDTTLPVPDRFDEALRILDRCDNLSKTTNQETLGQAGAIYKLKWQWDGNKQHLEHSCAYYSRGAQQDIREDSGYTAINAAFVLDLLAHEEALLQDKTAIRSDAIWPRREEATELRKKIVDTLTTPPKDREQLKKYEVNSRQWWFKATLAEACFGIGSYEEAGRYLRMRHDMEVPEWELESTARQLVTLYNLIDDISETKPKALIILSEFITDTALIAPLASGKVGLALSGGGFRAALFHIGVLARLAELDVLRNVEVISCVSGGSIVGTCYALALKNLLASKNDREITRCDYIKLVNDLIVKFPEGVRRNLRLRLFTNVVSVIKMVWHGFSLSYTHTHRIGELYEEHLFSSFASPAVATSMTTQDLCVNPEGKENERPRDYNWKRLNKVPTLIINATTLNTGHNWQFTPTWMGEPPKGVDADICVNERLRRMYYDDAPEKFRKFPLGMAVAASSCVPGLFPPLPVKGLYPERIVKLVDGGVYDNQGVASLLEQGCSVFLVSDASGQMQTSHKPSNSIVTILKRANDVQATRLRVTQYREISSKTSSTQKNGLCFLHLMEGLNEPPVDWIDCKDPSQHTPEYPTTAYGIYMKCQRALARIRTDLDSFSNIESNALMTSGYQLADHLWTNKLLELFPSQTSVSPIAWSFFDTGREIANIPPEKRIILWLEIGSRRLFRVFAYMALKNLPTVNTKRFFCFSLLAITAVLAWDTRKLFDLYGLQKTALGWSFILTYGIFFLIILPILFAILRAGALQLYLKWRRLLRQVYKQ